MRDGGLVGTEVFTPGQYLVGRDPDSDLVLDDVRVSGTHATLIFAEGRVGLKDHGSVNGIIVNGTRVAGCEIRSIDDVVIGPFTLKVRVTGKKPAPRPAVSQPTLTDPFAAASTVRAPVPPRTPQTPVPPPYARPQTPARAPVPPSATAPLGSRPPPVPAAPPARSVSNAVTAPHPIAIPPEARPPQSAPASEAVTLPATPVVPAAARPTPLPAASVVPLPVPPTATPSDALPFYKEPFQEPSHAAPGAPSVPPAGKAAAPGVAKPLTPARKAVDPNAPMLEVRVLWGTEPVQVRAFPFGATFRAGPGEDYDVPLYGFPLPEGDYSFAITEEGRWVARIPRGVTAAIREGGKWSRVDVERIAGAQGATVPLKPGTALRMTQGGVSVELLAVAPQPMPKVSPLESFELRPVLLFAAVALAMGWGVVLMPEPKAIEPVPQFDQKKLTPIRAQLKPPEKPKPAKKPKTESQKLAQKAAKKREVANARPASKPTPRPQNVDQAIKTVQKITSGAAVQNILAATSKITGNAGFGDKGTGYKLSSLNGKPPVAMAGTSFGEGLGGFGTKTKGFGSLRGTGGKGPGGFAAGSAGKKKVAGTVVTAPARQATVRGSLDRDQIAKVINSNIQQIRSCYERALLKEPGLGGRLVVEWTIGTNGRVAAVKTRSSTVKGATIPNCVLNSLKTWRFPKPKGGPVVVSYPFIFNSMGF